MSKSDSSSKIKAYTVYPIGVVHGSGKKRRIALKVGFASGLKQLDQFSHVIVVWWADKRDDPKHRSLLQTKPPYAKNVLTGIFATRAEYRPNPVAVTTCKILAVDEKKGVVEVAGLDAHAGTPVIDLKAYFPVCDRVKEAKTPQWLPAWPEWVPE
jgi:tRNA-Thr(GGU) m(6)t(6)A37 methyltransferase TsaA